MLTSLKTKMTGFFTGISFRILFFNVLIIFLAVSSFFSINSYEKQMLCEMEVSLNEQARFIAGSLAAGDRLNKDRARRIIESLPWTDRNRIQVFNQNGTLLYQTRLENWDTGPDPTYIREKFLYKIAVGVISLLSSSNRNPEPNKTDQKSIQQRDVERVLHGKPFAGIVRNRYQHSPVVLVSTFPIKRSKIRIGVVRIHKSANHILLAVYQFRWNALKLILVAVAVAIILNIVLTRTILAPIKRLTKNARELCKENDKEHPHSMTPLSGYNEITSLSKVLAQLTDQFAQEIIQNREFVDDLVHELKNPLAAIRSASEMLEMAENEDDKARFMAMITSDVSRIETLLSNVKDLNHIKTSTKDDKPDIIDIVALTGKYINYRKQLDLVPLEMDCNESNPLLVRIEEDRYIQLIDNLVQNALSFSPPQEPVRVVITGRKKVCAIEVKDRGTGIDPHHLHNIFQRFFSIRSDGELKKHSGLGLAIAKSIVTNINGTIDVFNRKQGGACFKVELPLAKDTSSP